MGDQNRDLFTSKFGVIAAAAGSAVGLGNIWKFPYIAGEYGGGAFLFVYLGFIIVIGLPIMISEFMIGRKAQKNAFGSFKALAPNSSWRITGLFGVIAAYLILSFYGVVAGWSFHYAAESCLGNLVDKTPQEFESLFVSFIEKPILPVVWQSIFMIVTAGIVLLGVQKGIEKYSKILMPLLVIILLVLVVRSVTLPGAEKGLAFLFKPDFSKFTMDGVLNALGHAFFSLSLGMGTLITYGSYVKKSNNIGRTAFQVSMADTLIAILAAIVIMPAVFAFDIAPGKGPGLVFITLPNVFQQMPGGQFFSVLFFVLLGVAALTSSISILEVIVTFFVEEFKMKRKTATLIAGSTTALVGVFCSLSMGVLNTSVFMGKNLFDTLDFFASNVFLPLGGLLIALFVGWYFGKQRTEEELSSGGRFKVNYINVLFVSLRYIAPIAIFIVLVYGIVENLEIYLELDIMPW
ncbi:sodium-dependent transporter [Labilibacter marinus]|uniref:sodium-dependent transporter n=1 Tax=Labilibacter marinus TaxID=1477105 RepID=UPI00082F227D|nr:sodium-dependent transporter [Labilibacter marinus]